VGNSPEAPAASLRAVEATVDAYYALERPVRYDLRLEQAVVSANREVHAFAQEKGRKASTTLVALLCLPDRVFVANVGDSRAYRIREGAIQALSQDHTLRAELVKGGWVEPEESDAIPSNRITRSIGLHPEIIPDVFELPLAAGDRFVLCSDGLTRHLHEEEILEVVRDQSDPQEAARTLTALANRRGGKDNITVMVIGGQRGLPRSLIFTLLRWLALVVLAAGLLWVGWRAYRNHGVGSPESTIPPFVAPSAAVVPVTVVRRSS
jgi:protein phosphatase